MKFILVIILIFSNVSIIEAAPPPQIYWTAKCYKQDGTWWEIETTYLWVLQDARTYCLHWDHGIFMTKEGIK